MSYSVSFCSIMGTGEGVEYVEIRLVIPRSFIEDLWDLT